MPATINCPTCGVLSYATDSVCANCGTALTGVAPINPVAPVADVPPQQRSPQEPAWPMQQPGAQHARAVPDAAAPGGGPFQAGPNDGYGHGGYGGYQPRTRDKGAVRSMVLGIVSLLICGIFFGPAAIYQGRKSLKRIEESGGSLDGDGFARAGVILGIIGTIGAVLLYGLYAWAASQPKYTF